MTSWTYMSQSLPWIIAGLIVGFLMGRSTVAADAIAGAVQAKGDKMSGTSEIAPEREPRGAARRVRFSSFNVLLVVVIVLGVFTAVQSYVQGEATQRLAACQTAYSNGFADALDARSQATSQAQDALDELLSKAASAVPSTEGREQVRRALSDYLAKRAEAKRTQKEHPFPPAPRDVCNER